MDTDSNTDDNGDIILELTKVLLIMSWVCIVFITIFAVLGNMERDELERYYEKVLEQKDVQLDHFKMYYQETYGGNLSTESYPVGLYYGDYFCVWVKDREYESVIETCNHEWLHYKWGEEHYE